MITREQKNKQFCMISLDILINTLVESVRTHTQRDRERGREDKMVGKIFFVLASLSVALAEITQLQMTDCGKFLYLEMLLLLIFRKKLQKLLKTGLFKVLNMQLVQHGFNERMVLFSYMFNVFLKFNQNIKQW